MHPGKALLHAEVALTSVSFGFLFFFQGFGVPSFRTRKLLRPVEMTGPPGSGRANLKAAIHQTVPTVMNPTANRGHWPFTAVTVAGPMMTTTQSPIP
jgi:hypothetical protein